ncbi:hypothetical protein [Rhodococcus tukisamuensis]|nr:hypothetical protein [Rhodococcus tukisamuensis]
MKPAISRRHMFEQVVHHMKDMDFTGVSTRRGKADDVFHVDGKGVVGRGTVQTSPVNATQLESVHKDMYSKKSADRWVHFSWGGYTKDAQTFANARGIALFEFQSDGRISPLSKRAAGMYRRKPSERWKTRAAWAVVVLVAIGAFVGALILFPAVRWVLGIIAVTLVLGLVAMVIDFINPRLVK